MENKNESNTAIRRLNAKGASGELKDKLMLFGQFVGDWENSIGEVHWGWILGGRATQDIWMPVGEAVPNLRTVVRFYDPKIYA